MTTFTVGTPNAIAALDCNTIFGLAADATVSTSFPLDTSFVERLGVAADGVGGYYYVSCPSADSGEMIALGADGMKRWEVDLATCDGLIIAGPEGPYLQRVQDGTTTAYAYADGSPRWSANLQAGGGFVRPRPGGGVFAYSTANSSQIFTLDASGAMLDTRSLLSSDGSPVVLYDFAPTDDGSGLAITGSFSSATLDLGDITLTNAANSATTFVAMLNTNATTRWAYTIPTPNNESCLPAACEIFDSIVCVGDQVVISGGYVGANTLGLPLPSLTNGAGDAFLAVFDATGFDHAVQIGGPSIKQPDSELVSESDGSIWVTIYTEDEFNATTDQTTGSSGLTIGSTTYTNPGDVSVTYLVNLVP